MKRSAKEAIAVKVTRSIELVILSWLLACVPVHACCSLKPASFSSTKGLAAEAQVKGKLVHLLAYQNAVQNLAVAGGNAMFLPIPAKKASMTRENILDTSTATQFLTDMERSITPVPRNADKSRSFSSNAVPEVIVFDHGIYTIVLAQDAKSIPTALSRVPVEKRPAMNNEIFDAYAKWYPGGHSLSAASTTKKNQVRHRCFGGMNL